MGMITQRFFIFLTLFLIVSYLSHETATYYYIFIHHIIYTHFLLVAKASWEMGVRELTKDCQKLATALKRQVTNRGAAAAEMGH